jgi:hypothetical protein
MSTRNTPVKPEPETESDEEEVAPPPPKASRKKKATTPSKEAATPPSQPEPTRTEQLNTTTTTTSRRGGRKPLSPTPARASPSNNNNVPAAPAMVRTTSMVAAEATYGRVKAQIEKIADLQKDQEKELDDAANLQRTVTNQDKDSCAKLQQTYFKLHQQITQQRKDLKDILKTSILQPRDLSQVLFASSVAALQLERAELYRKELQYIIDPKSQKDK